jgi:predicted Zn-dependent protease
MAAIMLLGINTGGSLSEATANALADDFESEADYLGSYMMARAGYDPEIALKFWQILALTLPDIGIDPETYSHPFDAERLNALRKAEREIREKQEAGSPLIPEQKPRVAASQSVTERAQERDPFAE